MLGFKNLASARILLGGIELVHMIAKGQMKDDRNQQSSFAQFYYLAA